MKATKTGESRRFGIADGLILIGGVATGFGALRGLWPDLNVEAAWNAIAHPHPAWSPWYALAFTVEFGVHLGIPLLAAWTPASLIVQLIRPRPTWRRLCRQPGFVACAIATAVIGVTVAAGSTGAWILTWMGQGSSPEANTKPCLIGGIVAGAGILGSWVTMRLCRVCRPRPTWTDQLGRLTGAAWVGIGVFCTVYICLAV